MSCTWRVWATNDYRENGIINWIKQGWIRKKYEEWRVFDEMQSMTRTFTQILAKGNTGGIMAILGKREESQLVEFEDTECECCAVFQ